MTNDPSWFTKPATKGDLGLLLLNLQRVVIALQMQLSTDLKKPEVVKLYDNLEGVYKAVQEQYEGLKKKDPS